MVKQTSFFALSALGLMLASAAGGCDDESTASTASTTNTVTTTGTQSGGGGSAGSTGGGASVGGSGGSGGAGGGSVMLPPSNANCDPPSGTPGNLTLTQVGPNFSQPVGLTYAWGDSERLYVVEQSGRIQLMKAGVATEFLDVSGRLAAGGERGLLGVAFHPDYVNNGRFFVHYSNGGSGPGASVGDTVIEEYARDASNPDLANPTPVQLIYTTDQPGSNHNGGTIAFNPADGYLYIALGDGGGANDPDNHGQRTNSPLGALLRLDVDGTAPYEIPEGNIDVVANDDVGEIYDTGLRNPYRMSFDVCTGDRYFGDVGQDCFEEISIAAADAGNVNWGWPVMEANTCFDAGHDARQCNSPIACDSTGLMGAAVEIPHGDGSNTITGGHVYRGSAIPWLRGAYFYGDFGQSTMFMLRWENGVVIEGPTDVASQVGVGAPSGFGVDNDGELYILNYGGQVYRVDAE